jgi:hypothetical protein
MSDTREHIHELIDRLPPTQLSAVAGLLEAILSPSANTTADDEPVTEEDQRRLRDGQAWFAQRGGRGVPMEEVLAGFGLNAEDFR